MLSCRRRGRKGRGCKEKGGEEGEGGKGKERVPYACPHTFDLTFTSTVYHNKKFSVNISVRLQMVLGLHTVEISLMVHRSRIMCIYFNCVVAG